VRREMLNKFWLGNLKVRDRSEVTGVDGTIKFESILEKLGGKL
jgi:hypothetical protein